MKINIIPALGSLIAFGAMFSLLNGTAQKFVPFTGTLNEIGTSICLFMIGINLLLCSFEKVVK